MRTTPLLLLLLLPFLCTILLGVAPSSSWGARLSREASTKYIDEVCRGIPTPYYGLCVRILESDPRSARANNVTGLAQIAIELTSRSVGRTLVHVQKLAVVAKEGSDLKFALMDCVDLYDTSFYWVAEANQFLDLKDYAMLGDRATRIHAYISRCEKGFEEVPPGPSPLTKENHRVEVMAKTIGSAADLLGGGRGSGV